MEHGKRLLSLARWSMVSVFVFYVLSYVINSAHGGYWLEPELDGRTEKLYGIVALKTAIMWQPRYGYKVQTYTEGLGSFYAPLIFLDQHFVHKTRYLGQKGTDEWIDSLPESMIHPRFRTASMQRSGPAVKSRQ